MFKIPDMLTLEKPSEMERLKPHIENENEVKRLFGIELAKGVQAFQAALNCGQETSKALYISQHWLNDPIVVETRKNTVHNSNDLLDAEELAVRLLEMAEERNASNTFYMLEGKDRLAALKLYADIRGYTKKDAVIPGGNTFIQNTMTIKLVEPERKPLIQNEEKPVEIVDSVSPIKLKLVG